MNITARVAPGTLFRRPTLHVRLVLLADALGAALLFALLAGGLWAIHGAGLSPENAAPVAEAVRP